MDDDSQDLKSPPVFKQAPFAQEIFTASGIKTFNQLEPKYRKLVDELVKTKDIKKAMQRAGVKESKRLKGIKTVKEALLSGGVDSQEIVEHLKECLDAKRYVLDKHGTCREITDLPLKLKTIEMICKLRGDFGSDAQHVTPTDTTELFKDVQLDAIDSID